MAYLGNIEKYKEITRGVTKVVTIDLIKMGIIKRWISRTAYAKYYGLCTKTVFNLTEFLRKKGAVYGKGKAVRYDKFCNPNTGECTIPNYRENTISYYLTIK